MHINEPFINNLNLWLKFGVYTIALCSLWQYCCLKYKQVRDKKAERHREKKSNRRYKSLDPNGISLKICGRTVHLEKLSNKPLNQIKNSSNKKKNQINCTITIFSSAISYTVFPCCRHLIAFVYTFQNCWHFPLALYHCMIASTAKLN